MTEPTALPKLLSEEEAAAFLKLQPVTLRRMRKRGVIGFIRIGVKFHYTEALLLQYIEANTCPASASPTNTPSSRTRAAASGTSNGARAGRRSGAALALQALRTPAPARES